jgi:hypothetical protein
MWGKQHAWNNEKITQNFGRETSAEEPCGKTILKCVTDKVWDYGLDSAVSD